MPAACDMSVVLRSGKKEQILYLPLGSGLLVPITKLPGEDELQRAVATSRGAVSAAAS